MSFKTLCDLALVADNVQVNILKISDGQFQVVIQPSLKLAEKYPQLESPLMVQAAPDQLGVEVDKALNEYTPVLKSAASNIAQIQQDMADAVKAASEAKAKKGTVTKTVPPAGTTTTNGATVTKPMAKAPDAPPDLFSGAGDAEPTTGAARPANGDGAPASGGALDSDDLPDLED